MKSCIGLPSVDKLDKWGYYLLCGFALFSNLTIAGGNIFLVPLVLVFFLRIISKRDDWRLALPDRRPTIAFNMCYGNFGAVFGQSLDGK